MPPPSRWPAQGGKQGSLHLCRANPEEPQGSPAPDCTAEQERRSPAVSLEKSAAKEKENKAPRHCFTPSIPRCSLLLPPCRECCRRHLRFALGARCPPRHTPAAPQRPSQVSSLSSLVQQHCRSRQSPPGCFLKIGGSLQVASPCRDTQDARLGLLTPARTQHTALQGSAPSSRGAGLDFVLSFHLFKHTDSAEEKVTVIVTHQLVAMEKIQI